MAAASWGELIRATQTTKITEQLPPASPLRATRFSGRGLWPRKPVEITTDAPPPPPDQVPRMNAARDRQLRHLQGHDPINHAPLTTDISDADLVVKQRLSATWRTAGGRGAATADATATAGAYESTAPFGLETTPRGWLEGEGYHRFGRIKSLAPQREENPLTHDRTVGPPRDGEMERAEALADAAVRYFKARNFDPLLQRYVDPLKDAACAAQEAEEAARRTGKWYRVMPPLQKVRPTMGYDVLSGTKIHEETAARVDAADAAARRTRYYDLGGYEARIQEAREGPALVAETRKLNNRAQRSWEQHASRDFDLLSTRERGFDWHASMGLAGSAPVARTTLRHQPPSLQATTARAQSAFQRVMLEAE